VKEVVLQDWEQPLFIDLSAVLGDQIRPQGTLALCRHPGGNPLDCPLARPHLSGIDSSVKKFCCKGPRVVVSDTFTKTELTLSIRFALDSPVQRRQQGY
jgi:hypothetical protein